MHHFLFSNKSHHLFFLRNYIGLIEEATYGRKFLDVGFNYKFTQNLKGKFGVYNILDEKAEDADGDQVLDGRRYGISFIANF